MAEKEKNPFAKFLTHFHAGTVLFHEGEDGDDMYIVQTGRVAIKKRVKDGEAVLATMEKGDFFGEMAILERLPRSATAEVTEESDLIVISSEVFGDMIKANPEIAVRMLRKYSIRLRETNKQLEQVMASGGAGAAAPAAEVIAPKGTAGTVQADALAYFVSPQSGNVFPIFKSDALIGRYDSVTGMHPEIDLTAEDQSRNISRRHARLVVKDGRFFVAEEIGTMNGTFLNGQKLANGVLTPIADGDELVLCRVPLTFKLSAK
ncbi:MAG TPA: cyclic nucleotide-binding domain-containing protein [Vicinamibacteria bacterium]|nr:cyclic nucleotide-binding domain-containing protein [Vicinamibacteria bacterium]